MISILLALLSADPAIAPYFQRFENEAQIYGHSEKTSQVVAYFNHKRGKAVAYCDTASRPTIVITEEYWTKADDIERELVVFHELGHCVLGRHHLNAQFSDGRPVSIMNYKNVSEKQFLENKDYYLRELFQ